MHKLYSQLLETDKQLIFLSDRVIIDTELSGISVECYNELHRMFSFTGYMIPRSKYWPWNPLNIKTLDDTWMPDFSETTNLTMEEITDNRAKEIANLAQTTDRPIVISYSGGIDSTLIVAAVVKNFPKTLLDRVILKMNNASYYENPYFFNHVIRKHGLSYTNEIKHDHTNSIVIAGEPGDSVNTPGMIPEIDLIYPGSWKWSAKKNPDTLLKWLVTPPHLGGKSLNKKHVEFHYETLIEDATLNGVEIETYEDFFWYAKQALTFGGNRLKLLNQLSTATGPVAKLDLDEWKTYAIPWFLTDDYQRWSNTYRNHELKYDGNIGNFKKSFKQYIFDVDRNPYYLEYKLKTYSKMPTNIKVDAVYDDGTCYMHSHLIGW